MPTKITLSIKKGQIRTKKKKTAKEVKQDENEILNWGNMKKLFPLPLNDGEIKLA